MAVKNTKTRIIFTLPKSQAEWLESTSKEVGISKSKLIRWLIEKNIQNIQQWATPDELETIIKIIRTPWIKNPYDDYDD